MKPNIKEAELTAGYDDNIEVVHVHNEAYFKHNKIMMSIKDCHPNIVKPFYEQYKKEIFESPEMIVAYQAMGLEPNEYFQQWLICNFGGEDRNPDLDLSTKSFFKEYWDCGIKDSCPGFGKGCRKDLTPRQYEILKLFKQGLPDKLIADQLNISENTVREHRRNIFSKFNCNNKQEAIRLAEISSIMI